MSNSIQQFNVLPAFEQAVYKDGKPQKSDSGLPMWSGARVPPGVNDVVQIKMNGIGAARVIGYFVMAGWLGLLVKPYDPPQWYVDQNGYDATGHVFGAEVSAELVSAPDLKGPTQEQLAALQRYAHAKGASWKRDLALAWASGADASLSEGSLLRQVRNQFGVAWLTSKDNPVRESGAA